MTGDPYEVLGVRPEAPAAEVRSGGGDGERSVPVTVLATPLAD